MVKTRRRRRKSSADFREFLFTATGKEIEPGKVSTIDVYDNLIVEADRLKTLADLLGSSNDALEVESLAGLSLLVGDIQRRLRGILEVAVQEGGRGGAARRGREAK